MTSDRTGTAVVTLPSDREIEITRVFEAPAELVFDVWTTPEHVRNWWGYESDPMTVCDIDLRVGGSYRFVAANAGYGEVAFHGVYKEIERPHRLVSTEVFEGYPDAATVNTLTLEENDGVTTMTILVLHESKESRDAQIASGMEKGLQHSLDRADEVLASLLESA
ncbi:MAG TPA: SRPBCC family protein [Acidimicrobiia bacterium]|nr:SRPBCC family protein [Acidimicrobiia bacterium]